MTDQQIDFKLALDIGYAPDRVRNLAYSTTKLWGTKLDSYAVHHNPATATALAVIAHKGKKL